VSSDDVWTEVRLRVQPEGVEGVADLLREQTGAGVAIEPAIEAMTGVKRKIYRPIPGHVAIYRELYGQYKVLHDAFGAAAGQAAQAGKMARAGHTALAGLMKNLLALKQKCAQE